MEDYTDFEDCTDQECPICRDPERVTLQPKTMVADGELKLTEGMLIRAASAAAYVGLPSDWEIPAPGESHYQHNSIYCMDCKLNYQGFAEFAMHSCVVGSLRPHLEELAKRAEEVWAARLPREEPENDAECLRCRTPLSSKMHKDGTYDAVQGCYACGNKGITYKLKLATDSKEQES